MSQILIPFSREMAIAVMKGEKVATTRSERKGEIGDWFAVLDPDERHMSGDFNLIEIMAVDLETVAQLYFRLEGFDSPEAFRATWRKLHRGHYTTGKLYYIHFFGRIA